MLNNWCGQGRLTRDIELNYTAGDVAVASFTIACDRDYKPKDGDRQADFIDIVAWRNDAEFVSKYFHQGDMIVVSGRIQTRTYEDKNGNKRKATEVIGSTFNFCGSRRESTNSTGANESQATYNTGTEEGFMQIPDDISDEGLPFR